MTTILTTTKEHGNKLEIEFYELVFKSIKRKTQGVGKILCDIGKH
jgi:hypothetical protein